MSGSRSRRKGAQAERDLAKRFAEAMPGCDAKRGIGQARRGSEVADVEVPYFWPECKKQKRGNVRAALAQAIEAAEGSGRVPVAFICDDRKEPFIAMREEDFFEFVREWWQFSPKDYMARRRLVWPDTQSMIDAVANDAEAKCAAAGPRYLAKVTLGNDPHTERECDVCGATWMTNAIGEECRSCAGERDDS